MRELSSDPPIVGLDPETDNTALQVQQHRTDNKATSMTSQTTKRGLALELPTCTEDQQMAWPQSTGLQVKKPRVQYADCEAAIDPQILSSNGTMSSHQQHPSFQTRSQQGGPADSQLERGAAVIDTDNTLSFPPPPSAPEGNAHGQSKTPMAYLPTNNANEIVRQTTPITTITEEQRFRLSSAKGNPSVPLTVSMFAPSQDLPPFIRPHPNTSNNSGEEQGENDYEIKKSLEAIRRQYWDQILVLFGERVPASIHEGVLHELCVVNYPWTSHKLYKTMMCEQRKIGSGNLKKLHEWMYGGRATTHATWRDTLRTKTGDDTKVPWVKREEIIALSVIMAARHAEGEHRGLRSQHDWVEECKLTYLTSGQDHVIPNEYWEGFAEELEKDPDQTNLYDSVMQNEPPSTARSSTYWSNVLIHDEEVHGHQERSDTQFLQEGYSGQAGAAGNASSQSMAGLGEGVHHHSDNGESSSTAQQIFPPARDNGQHTEEPISQEQSLQHRVQMLEDGNMGLQMYIQRMHQ